MALADPSVEQNLRELGFGYRAKYIQSTAHMIAYVKPSGWLSSLRTQSYPIVKESLLELPGVGPKVADCVVIPLQINFIDVVFVLIRSTVCGPG
jgi:N-glycosylase/DNA lyase